jgi:hypothetical protein
VAAVQLCRFRAIAAAGATVFASSAVRSPSSRIACGPASPIADTVTCLRVRSVGEARPFDALAGECSLPQPGRGAPVTVGEVRCALLVPSLAPQPGWHGVLG